MFYSIVNPLDTYKSWDSKSNITVTTTDNHSYADIQNAHYKNICAYIDQTGVFNCLKQLPVVYCLTGLNKTITKQVMRRKDIVSSRIIYYTLHNSTEHNEQTNLRFPYELKHLLWGDLLAMKLFTGAYKTFEGDKWNICKPDHALESWVVANSGSLNVHRTLCTNLQLKPVKDYIKGGLLQ